MAVKVVDDRSRELTFFGAPRRVVSLVPSDTLSVADLGAGSALIACTDYCELPADLVKDLPRIGGTKNPRIADILALQPDLVLANQEENTRSDLEALAQAGLRVLVAFPQRVIEGLAHLARLARIFHVDREPAVRALLARGYHAHAHAEARRAERRPLSTFCPIWMQPLMTIHGSTFISDMLDLAGAPNVFSDRVRKYPLAADLGKRAPLPHERVQERDTRYPRITLDEVVQRAPELVLLPNEPHPFSEADAEVFRALDIPAARNGRVHLCDGKDLCWYGSRSVDGIARLGALVDELAARGLP